MQATVRSWLLDEPDEGRLVMAQPAPFHDMIKLAVVAPEKVSPEAKQSFVAGQATDNSSLLTPVGTGATACDQLDPFQCMISPVRPRRTPTPKQELAELHATWSRVAVAGRWIAGRDAGFHMAPLPALVTAPTVEGG